VSAAGWAILAGCVLGLIALLSGFGWRELRFHLGRVPADGKPLSEKERATWQAFRRGYRWRRTAREPGYRERRTP
jgi:hypothetical protein